MKIDPRIAGLLQPPTEVINKAFLPSYTSITQRQTEIYRLLEKISPDKEAVREQVRLLYFECLRMRVEIDNMDKVLFSVRNLMAAYAQMASAAKTPHTVSNDDVDAITRRLFNELSVVCLNLREYDDNKPKEEQ